MKLLQASSTLAFILLSQGMSIAADQKMTTYQRQVNLMQRVNNAQKSKQLSVKQAKELRKDLSKIAVQKQKIRDAKIGKDQSANAKNIEQRLTETSKKIDRLKKENTGKTD